MASSTNIPVSTSMDVTPIVKGANEIVRQFERIHAEIRVFQGAGAAKAFRKDTREFKRQSAELTKLRAQYAELAILKKRMEEAGTVRTRNRPGEFPLAQQLAFEQRGTNEPIKQFSQVGVTKQLAEIEQKILDVQAATEKAGEALVNKVTPLPELWDRVTLSIQKMNREMVLTNAALEGGLNDQFVQETVGVINREISALRDQQRALDQSVREQGSEKYQAKAIKAMRAGEQATDLEKQASDLQAIIDRRDRAAVLAAQAADADRDDLAIAKERAEIAKMIADREVLINRARDLRRQANIQQEVSKGDREEAGLQGVYEDMDRRITNLIAKKEQLYQTDAIRQLHPELEKEIAELQELQNISRDLTKTDEVRHSAAKKAAGERIRLEEKMGQLARESLGKDVRDSPEVMEANLEKTKSGINRLFTNISQDLSRRFITTLQFAVSGALLFGAQKFLRDFVQSAIEVERTFKDIESALEFDIEAPRGSTQFAHEVEGLRQKVLLLANEFNTLPTEANKSAYVMVARFKDMGNAMVALRAQLLATKVSTIEQSEVLRALTATAEAFAASTLELNDGLSLQERLLRREAVSASLYGKALDLAVQFQQKFGIEVEDTLEGTARSAQVFRQMGFSMEETAAIVASTSRELGQTGQQVAERLNRSLGQLTDPKIREALLGIAGTTKEFTLQISDFESGAKAWHTIADQFERLEKTAPAAAREILQIIGQRRELEAVAAALGTSDMQESMVAGADSATGAAETRFQFLSVTIDEMLKSVAASVQELSQNFERLGALSALKILLATFDKFVTLLNDAVKAVIDLRDWVDSVTGGFGSWLTHATLFALALKSALRIALEIRKVFIQSTLAQGGLKIFSNFLGGQSGAVAARTVGFGPAVATGAGAAASTGLLGRAGASLGGTAQAAAAGITALASSTAVLAVGAVAAGVAIYGFYKKNQQFAKDAIRNSQNLASATVRARREALSEGLSLDSIEFKILQLELQIDQLRTDREQSQSGGLKISFDVREQDLAKLPPDRRYGPDGQGVLTITPGSQEYIDAQTTALTRELLALKGQQLIEQIENADIDVGDTPVEDVRRAVTRAIGKDIRGFSDPIAAAKQALIDAITEQMEVVNKPFDINDVEALAGHKEEVATANAAVAEAEAAYGALLAIYGLLPEQLQRSVDQLKKDIAKIDQDVALGRIDISEASDLRLDAAEKLRQSAADYAKSGSEVDKEAAEAALADADAAELAALEDRKAALDERIARENRFLGEAEAQSNTIVRLAQFIAGERARGYGAGAFKEQQDAMIDAIKQQAVDNRERLLDDYAFAVQMARNDDETIRATQSQIDNLRKTANRFAKDSVLYRQYTHEADLLQKDNNRKIRELSVRAQIATYKLSRAVLDPMAGLVSTIKEMKVIIANAAGDYSFAEILEAEQSMREAYAQIAQVELARLTALSMSKVSVRDAMNQELVQLSGLRQAAKLAAEQYGKNTQAHLDALWAIKESEARLADMVLELESVKRQLDPSFDVTNPLKSAEEEYIKAARMLQIPDLGDAERANAELQLRNAEAARLSASFNEGMFDLKFQFEKGTLGKSGYIESLRGMLASVDTSTHQGKELWLQINGLIEGLTSDISGAAFNIPGSIRIPTLFEVRRAVQAESLGVNYLDNRDQQINVYVSDDVQLDAVFEAISGAFDVEDARFAPGGAGITLGGP